MNYLTIRNNGLICPEDLMLIGSSTKRDQSGKIGMFGSGWKYSLAWLIRNGCKPTILSGENFIDIDFTVKMHRDKAVEVITVNEEATSLTTEMGPKWTGWMAIREVLSNAIDEGGHSINTAWNPMPFKGEPGITTIFIPMNSELSEVMLKFDTYFAFHRKESFANEHARFFIKKEPTPLNIYRKGIRCFDTNFDSTLDIDFNEIDINEDRLTSDYSIGTRVRSIVSAGIPSYLLKAILKEEREAWVPYDINDKVMANINDLLAQGETFTTKSIQKLGGVLLSDPNSLVIRAEWYKNFKIWV